MRSRSTADGAPGYSDKREPPSREGVCGLTHLGGATRHPLDSGQAGRRRSLTSTLIRHAGPALPLTVGSLAVPMIEFSFRAALVPTVGLTQLSTAVALPAQHATVAVSSIAGAADPERAATAVAPTESQPKDRLCAGRHPLSPAGVDKRPRIVAGYLSIGWRLAFGPTTTRRPRSFPRPGSSSFPPSEGNQYPFLKDLATRLRRG